MHVTALVVTYNRKALLARCLQSMHEQTRRPDRVLIVDNASGDGTREMLHGEGWLQRAGFELLALDDNTGGAGGFAAGLAHAVATSAEWIWLMDDDALPHRDALERLLARGFDPADMYGSAAVSGERLAWPMMPHGGREPDMAYRADELGEQVEVQFIPFLGLMLHASMVRRIGVPDAGFFIAADDVDYSFRARAAGARLWLVPASRIEHPASERYFIGLPGRRFHALRLVPWKRYYDVRNRIFVARNHYGAKLYYGTLPGSALRLLATLWHEKQRMRQLWAFIAGMTDGLLGRKGRRHERWGLRP